MDRLKQLSSLPTIHFAMWAICSLGCMLQQYLSRKLLRASSSLTPTEISKGLNAGRSSEPWARVRRSSTAPQVEDDFGADTPFDGRKALSDLIGRTLNTVCQTLSSRIELAARTCDDPVLIYKMYNLLTFYREIFAKLLGSRSSDSKDYCSARDIDVDSLRGEHGGRDKRLPQRTIRPVLTSHHLRSCTQC